MLDLVIGPTKFQIRIQRHQHVRKRKENFNKRDNSSCQGRSIAIFSSEEMIETNCQYAATVQVTSDGLTVARIRYQNALRSPLILYCK